MDVQLTTFGLKSENKKTNGWIYKMNWSLKLEKKKKNRHLT